VLDAGLYVQDDWRWKPYLTLSAGVRYEGQSGIADHADFAARVAVAWAPGGAKTRNPKTVIRAATGVFYDRFAATLLMNAALLNGINQTQYIVRNPLFYPDVPELATVAELSARQATAGSHIRYRVDSGLRVPYVIETAAGIEHQLPHGLSFAVNYSTTRGIHQLLTRDLNAPVPTVFNKSGRGNWPEAFRRCRG
jgi:TonB dependent receptor